MPAMPGSADDKDPSAAPIDSWEWQFFRCSPTKDDEAGRSLNCADNLKSFPFAAKTAVSLESAMNPDQLSYSEPEQ